MGLLATPQVRANAALGQTRRSYSTHLQGVIELLAEHHVCTAGQTLTPQQAAVLRVFGQRQAEFVLTLLACWRGTCC